MRISTISSRVPVSWALSTEFKASMSSFSSRPSLTKARSGTWPDKVTTTTGNSEKLISSIIGSSESSGKFGWAKSTCSRTSRLALATSKPASNSSTILAPPSNPLARISFSPSTERSFCSNGRIRRFSESSGEMPSCMTRTMINGMLMSGSASLGISTYATAPAISSNTSVESVVRALEKARSMTARMASVLRTGLRDHGV